jgi:hypothetical protein
MQCFAILVNSVYFLVSLRRHLMSPSQLLDLLRVSQPEAKYSNPRGGSQALPRN